MASRNGGWPHLRLEDMSDIELLVIHGEAADGDGGATALQVAEKTDEGPRAARAIGSRFAWMKRWGFMDNEPDRRWFLTQEGEALKAGSNLTQAQLATVQRASARVLGLGDAIGAYVGPGELRMLRRQLRHREVAGGR